MQNQSNCGTCVPCDSLADLNSKIISIADNRLYNIRYELNRHVDYELFKLLVFYKGVAEDICDGIDCGCYTQGINTPLNHEGCCKSESIEIPLTVDNIIERIKILTS